MKPLPSGLWMPSSRRTRRTSEADPAADIKKVDRKEAMKKTRADIPGVDWVPTDKPFIQIATDRCTGCANCVKVCLGDCYELRDKKAHIRSLDTCMECGACWYVCECDAVLFSWPPGGTGFKTKWG